MSSYVQSHAAPVQVLAQRRRPPDQKGYDILHKTAAVVEGRRDVRRQAAAAAEMQVPSIASVLAGLQGDV